VSSSRRSGTRQTAWGHFEIQRFRDLGLQSRHVVVADVTPVLAQMRGDAIGARGDCEQSRSYRVGCQPCPRIAERGDVIDIDPKAERRNGHHGLSEISR
jgi:hypothetical protein